MLWFSQLLLAVDYLHSLNLIHQDLKSANVFMNQDFRVQLGDFGMVGAPLQAIKAVRLFKEKQEVNGTYQYMSPELLQYEPPSFRSDCWALGVILYEVGCIYLSISLYLSKLLKELICL